MAGKTFVNGMAATLLALGLAAPAAAKLPDTRPIAQAEVLAAWKAICFDNSFDSAAQVKAAKAAPYFAIEGETEPDGSRPFTGPTLQIWIKSDAKSRYCAVAANLSDLPDHDAGMRFVNPLIAAEPMKDGEDKVFWVVDGKDYVLAIGFGSGIKPDGAVAMLIGSGVDLK